MSCFFAHLHSTGSLSLWRNLGEDCEVVCCWFDALSVTFLGTACSLKQRHIACTTEKESDGKRAWDMTIGLTRQGWLGGSSSATGVLKTKRWRRSANVSHARWPQATTYRHQAHARARWRFVVAWGQSGCDAFAERLRRFVCQTPVALLLPPSQPCPVRPIVMSPALLPSDFHLLCY